MQGFSWKGALAATVCFSLCACTAPKPPAPVVAVEESRTPSGGSVEQTTTVTATVQAVDQDTRVVTLIGHDGKQFTVRAGDEVRNLAQVRHGDHVTIVFYEAVAYEVKKKGTAKPDAAAATEVARAPIGQRPAAGAAHVVTVTATIKSIDRKTNTVELRGPKGRVVPIKVKDPSRLEGVKVGDLVEITYTDAVAISVNPAPKG